MRTPGALGRPAGRRWPCGTASCARAVPWVGPGAPRSNWSSFYREVALPGARHVAQLPVLPQPLPGFGVMVIFRPCRDRLAVYYTVRDREAMARLAKLRLLGPVFKPFARDADEKVTVGLALWCGFQAQEVWALVVNVRWSVCGKWEGGRGASA